MEQLKVNIIGIGIMGTNVARVLSLNPQARITAASALSQETLDKARAEFKLERTYTDYEKMIAAEKPDIVYVCTPDQAHLAPVMACLESGIHVQVEKPMATSEEDAAAMVRKVNETGLKLQVSFNHRWLAVYHQTKQIIKSGQIGRPVCGYARKNNPIDVPTKMVPWARNSSPMWFLSCHDIDLMTWWFDEDPVEVKAFGHKGVLKKKFDFDCYDAMQGLVRFGSGAFATFEAAWIYPECHPARPDSFMEVIGEQGHMHLDRKMEQIEMSSPEGMGWPRSLLMANVFGHQVGAFPSCVNSFIEIVLEDKKPIVSAYDGWRSTAILDAIHRSADSGQTISVSKAPLLK